MAKADIVIEAIFEDLNAKRELFARIEPKLKPLAVLRNEHVEHRAGTARRILPRPSG